MAFNRETGDVDSRHGTTHDPDGIALVRVNCFQISN